MLSCNFYMYVSSACWLPCWCVPLVSAISFACSNKQKEGNRAAHTVRDAEQGSY